ncbi:MAG: hypothetical protein ACE5JI_08735 [Acidobacteriota bacterium]
MKNAGDLREQDKRRSETIMQALSRGFIALASEGYEFLPVSRIREAFGKSLEENYPEANAVFLSFATTYWTFKLWLGDVQADFSGTPIAAGLLGALEEQVAALFFPTPGPTRMSPSLRESTQRETLLRYGARFDIDEFMRGNPILKRDLAARRGCLGALLLT